MRTSTADPYSLRQTSAVGRQKRHQRQSAVGKWNVALHNLLFEAGDRVYSHRKLCPQWAGLKGYTARQRCVSHDVLARRGDAIVEGTRNPKRKSCA